MQIAENTLNATAAQLSQAFLSNYPVKSARFLETQPPKQAAKLLAEQPVYLVSNLWKFLPPGSGDAIFDELPGDYASRLILGLDSHLAIGLLSRLEPQEREPLFTLLAKHSQTLADEYRGLMEYPEDTAGRLMHTRIQAFAADTTAQSALQQLKHQMVSSVDCLYLLDQQQKLVGEVALTDLLHCPPSAPLSSIATPIKTFLNALDDIDQVTEKFEGYRVQAIPVLDLHGQLIGAIRFFDVYQSTKEDLVSDMQTMVGASADERALSSSFFAVKKRLPWLHINLLTAFAAAAVVGAFEGLISEVTALAILLPVAAGQSGNAGAQALAVTMRGLTLREITTRHWSKVFFKEMFAGFMIGIAIAITCGLGVYVWSQSIGLALVISLAMILSLAVACSAGALVPIILKKAGLDPAQSSSIVLTTITDITGFMSFLGIAMLLTDMLPRG
ncbi:magnesium transporter [Aliiglaciecola sp. CAU 1673]|uniref:magnesium transporter n=1 Tax=Aliiglaciecola sp. CAU 1673 TaxID=3032595 RepID=UPI0023DAF9FD|nr:magnesium transporter [Aliiglaciecola sp. CAU 1673]MDF2177249.1 magnesium transporter [Aliiglaciecola sp. CAU 1673]